MAIIGGRNPAASTRAEGKEGGVVNVSAAARPLLGCPAKIGGRGRRRKGGRIFLVPFWGKGNPKGKAEASSWFRSGAADVETDMELERTLLLFTVGFLGGILAQGRR